MNVAELIKELSKYPADTRVLVFDPDSIRSYPPAVAVAEEYTDHSWREIKLKHVEIRFDTNADDD